MAVTFDVSRTVNQRCYLELMPVSIPHIGKCFCKVHMFSTAYINSRRGSSTEFVEMSVSKVGAEFYFVYMGVPHADCLAGNGTKTMVVTFTAFIYDSSASSDFVYVTLRIIAIRIIC